MRVLTLALFFLLIGASASTFDIQPVKSATTIVVPDDYAKIQWAIGNASAGDTIFVRAGTYYEHLTIDKSLSLIGENRSTTVIDGNGTGNVVYINVTNVDISEFQIRKGTHGFYLHGCNNTILSNMNVLENGGGIYLYDSTAITVDGNWIEDTVGHSIFLSNSYGNIIGNNTISRRGGYGVYLFFSDNNTVKGNSISEGSEYAGNGIELAYSQNNVVTKNTISNNGGVGISLEWARTRNNMIWHNNFINNRMQVYIYDSFDNTWDDGYPSGGNYWSDYVDEDIYSGPNQDELGSDGVWDNPYVIDTNNQDNYSLVIPFILGDLNRDGYVNIFDMLVVRDSLGSEPGHPNWHPLADLNDDGYINIYDLLVVRDNLT